MLSETKDNLNKWRNRLCSQVRRLISIISSPQIGSVGSLRAPPKSQLSLRRLKLTRKCIPEVHAFSFIIKPSSADSLLLPSERCSLWQGQVGRTGRWLSGGRSLAQVSSGDSVWAVSGVWHQGGPCLPRLGQCQDFFVPSWVHMSYFGLEDGAHMSH